MEPRSEASSSGSSGAGGKSATWAALPVVLAERTMARCRAGCLAEGLLAGHEALLAPPRAEGRAPGMSGAPVGPPSENSIPLRPFGIRRMS